MSRIARYRTPGRVQVETVASRTGAGQAVKTWADVFTCWVDIRHAYKAEDALGGVLREAVQPRIVTQEFFWVKFRYRASAVITPKHRFVTGSRVFEIISVLDLDGRRRETSLYCREIQL